MLFTSIKNNLRELTQLLDKLSAQQFSHNCEVLSGGSIGAHYRHIIEIYTCLLSNYDFGKINYDNRKRDIKMQTDPEIAVEKLSFIEKNIERINKKLTLKQCLNDTEVIFETNYYRELLYNLEHAIHHQALIKIAVNSFQNIDISEYFGVSPATIAHRNKCDQQS